MANSDLEEAYAAAAPVREQLQNMRPSRAVAVTADEVDKIQVALHRTLGCDVRGYPGIEPFKGLKHAYLSITGQSLIRLDVGPSLAREAIVATDFPSLLARSMTLRIVQDYTAPDFHESIFVSHSGSAVSFKTQEAVRVGGWRDIPVINPETDDYTEAQKPNEEYIPYEIETRGELIRVSEIAIRNDQTAGLIKAIRNRGRAYRRTYARFVWSFFTENLAFHEDGLAWFSEGHGNLFSDPISPDKIIALCNSIWGMTEDETDEPIAFNPDRGTKLRLIVGRDLFFTAKTLNEAQYLDADMTPNPVWRLFGERNERIVVSPKAEDKDNWGIVVDPTDREIVEIKFLEGREQPEIIISREGKHQDEMLRRDMIVFKDRFSFGGNLVNWRNAAKSIVPS